MTLDLGAVLCSYVKDYFGGRAVSRNAIRKLAFEDATNIDIRMGRTKA